MTRFSPVACIFALTYGLVLWWSAIFFLPTARKPEALTEEGLKCRGACFAVCDIAGPYAVTTQGYITEGRLTPGCDRCTNDCLHNIDYHYVMPEIVCDEISERHPENMFDLRQRGVCQ